MSSPSLDSIKKLIKDFEEASNLFNDCFLDFAADWIISKKEYVGDKEYCACLKKIKEEIWDYRKRGYIVDYSIDDMWIKLLDVPTEEELKDEATLKKYSEAVEIYNSVSKEIHDNDHHE